MPKKLGRGKNPPLHYSSNGSVEVPSRYIMDCDLAEMESFILNLLFFNLLLVVIEKRINTMSLWSVIRYLLYVTKAAVGQKTAKAC